MECLFPRDEWMQQGEVQGGQEACRFPIFPSACQGPFSRFYLVSMGNDEIDGKKTIFSDSKWKANSTLKKEFELG